MVNIWVFNVMDLVMIVNCQLCQIEKIVSRSYFHIYHAIVICSSTMPIVSQSCYAPLADSWRNMNWPEMLFFQDFKSIHIGISILESFNFTFFSNLYSYIFLCLRRFRIRGLCDSHLLPYMTFMFPFLILFPGIMQ